MKIISFNQKWIFKNELKNIPEQTVDLPHDAMLTEKRLPEGKAGAAGAYFPGGKYSYRKDLFGAEEYRDKSVYLEFEGVLYEIIGIILTEKNRWSYLWIYRILC